MVITTNIHRFKDRFWQEYDFLYQNRDNVAGFREAVEEFDRLLSSNDSFKHFVTEFCKIRTVLDGVQVFDPITSDREAAAFMFTLVDEVC